MKRYGSVIGVRPEAIEEYKKFHSAVWPEVLDMIRNCNIRNYSIFLKDDLLFGYWEYHGTDFQADMAKMAADPKTQEWWKIRDRCNDRLNLAPPANGGPTWKKSFISIEEAW